MNPWNERIRLLRGRLDLDQEAMGRALGVSREWISKLERGHEQPSAELRAALQDMERDLRKSELTDHLKTGDKRSSLEEESAPYSRGVALNLLEQRRPSTRGDCESYIRHLFDAAEIAADPDAFPAVMRRLKKHFPLAEWETPPKGD